MVDRGSLVQKVNPAETEREREGEGGREGEKEGKIFELRTKLLLKYWCCEKKKIYTHSSLRPPPEGFASAQTLESAQTLGRLDYCVDYIRVQIREINRGCSIIHRRFSD